MSSLTAGGTRPRGALNLLRALRTVFVHDDIITHEPKGLYERARDTINSYSSRSKPDYRATGLQRLPPRNKYDVHCVMPPYSACTYMRVNACPLVPTGRACARRRCRVTRAAPPARAPVRPVRKKTSRFLRSPCRRCARRTVFGVCGHDRGVYRRE